MWKFIGALVVMFILIKLFDTEGRYATEKPEVERPSQELIDKVMERKAQRAADHSNGSVAKNDGVIKQAEQKAKPDPYNLCQAITFEGYNFSGWKYLEGLGWGCGSDLQYNYTDSSLNEISFYIRSVIGAADTEDMVEKIEIQASIFDNRHTEKVKSEFKKKVRMFFSGSGLTEPEGLLSSIESETDYFQDMEYGKVKMIRENDYNIGYGLMITISF